MAGIPPIVHVHVGDVFLDGSPNAPESPLRLTPHSNLLLRADQERCHVTLKESLIHVSDSVG